MKPSLFAWNYNTENVSMMPAIINTLSITAMTLLFSVPAGIFAAIYLVEYAKRGNKFVSVVRMTTETLAGIPSIVFGLFGYLFFNIYLKWGYSILGGALTLSIMVLPLILRINGGSTPSRFGYLPRGQLRAWRRKAENRISYCAALRSAGDSGMGLLPSGVSSGKRRLCSIPQAQRRRWRWAAFPRGARWRYTCMPS